MFLIVDDEAIKLGEYASLEIVTQVPLKGDKFTHEVLLYNPAQPNPDTIHGEFLKSFDGYNEAVEFVTSIILAVRRGDKVFEVK